MGEGVWPRIPRPGTLANMSLWGFANKETLSFAMRTWTPTTRALLKCCPQPGQTATPSRVNPQRKKGISLAEDILTSVAAHLRIGPVVGVILLASHCGKDTHAKTHAF